LRRFRRSKSIAYISPALTISVEPSPPELESLLKRRRRLGLDHRDEVSQKLGFYAEHGVEEVLVVDLKRIQCQ
jgi:hypothetical protein